MQFYEITLRSVPEILFAYHVSSEHYRNRFPSYENLLEISVIETGTIHYEYDGGGHSETPAGTLAPILKDLHCRTYTDAGVLQKHVTVGMAAEYDLKRHTVEGFPRVEALRESVKKSGTILLPFQWDLGKRYDEIAGLVRDVVYAYASTRPSHRLDALSAWFRLTAMLTELVLARLSGDRAVPLSAASAYVREARQFLAEHYGERLSVGDVAAHLGISAGYLHGIFKRDTGMGVLEYLNRYRVDTMKQLVLSRGLSLKEAAAEVGIDDPSYMSRLFKKTEGHAFRDYLREISQTAEQANPADPDSSGA